MHRAGATHFHRNVPIAVVCLVVILVMIFALWGIRCHNSAEQRIHRLGYPIEQAKVIASKIDKTQCDSLVARETYDSLAYAIVTDRYYIQQYFEDYLAFHQADTSSMSAQDIVAVINVHAERPGYGVSVPCDTSKGNLMLVNKYHYLDTAYIPHHQVRFEKNYAFGENWARKEVVENYMALQKDAKAATGKQLIISSAYRSGKRQIKIHNPKKETLTARSGYSEHQTGLCLDIVSMEHTEIWSFGKSAEGKWMRENCHKYGFIVRYPKGKSHITGYQYEPWHLRYVGKDVAKKIHDEGITFDEYYAFYINRD